MLDKNDERQCKYRVGVGFPVLLSLAIVWLMIRLIFGL